MKPKKISKQLLKRLPLYLDYLKSIPENSENTSATAIAKALDLGDVQVRKDLARVSDSGRRKTGRDREQLIKDIEAFLDFATTTDAIIVGAGKLGRALLDYQGFEKAGMNLIAGFDTKPEPDCSESGKPVYPMTQLEVFCKNNDIRIGIIAVPDTHAQEVCDSLVDCGIRAIWNFAPVHLIVPEHIVIQSENLAVSLTALRVQLKNQYD